MSGRRRLSAILLAVVAMAASASQAQQNESASPAVLVERYVAAFNAHDAEAFGDIVAANYVQHNGRTGQGLAGLQAALRTYFQTFPDFRMSLDDRIVQGDKAVARVTLTATHSQPVQLAPNAPVFAPTGKKLSWGDIEIWRVADGKFAEHWDQSDLLGLARQLRGE
jgi:predicted ester cyclase